jgi:hypothetical protein
MDDGVDKCVPGGNRCWARIVDVEPELPGVPVTPTMVAEAIDFLSSVWRLAFGKQHALLTLRTMVNATVIGQPCTTRDSFIAATTALDDTLKGMSIADELLDPADLAADAQREDAQLRKDLTFNRLRACLKFQLRAATDNLATAEAALKKLRLINDVRVALQHSGRASGLMPALDGLGIPTPPGWADAWDIMRVRLVEALADIRRALQPLADR